MSVATGIDKDRARIGGYQKGIGLRIVRWMISRLRQGDGRVQGSVRILALSVPSATSDSWIRIVAPCYLMRCLTISDVRQHLTFCFYSLNFFCIAIGTIYTNQSTSRPRIASHLVHSFDGDRVS
jgi:hypothetical protein